MNLAAPTLVGILVVAAVVVVVVRFEVFCLTDIAQADRVCHLSKPAWTALTVIAIPFGGLLYLAYGRVR